MTQKIILITGWAGYIGSHVVVTLEQAGYKTVIINNPSNSAKNTLSGIQKILWYIPDFFQGDICNKEFLTSIFEKYTFDTVIHLAGFKWVGDSCENPFPFYQNNILGSISLFEVMDRFSVKNIIFSSSATVYDMSNAPIFREEDWLWSTNPYGTTKRIIEEILCDMVKHKNWSVISLRYFNPIGAHPSWYIGAHPNGKPDNIFPYIMDVAIWIRTHIDVFGSDYDTKDGTCIRDYIDICDLADVHICAIENLKKWFFPVNIGSWRWSTVLEIIQAIQDEIKVDIPYKIIERRPWDIWAYYANADRSFQAFWWQSKRSIAESARNNWKYIQNTRHLREHHS